MNMNYPKFKIEINNLTKKYHKRYVYKNFNYVIENLTINYLKSPNGYGKSTLIKCILNLISYNGTIKSNVKTFAYLPERIIVPELIKVEKFLGLMLLDNEKVNYLLSQFKIDKTKYIYELSKGMRQKILLIQALATNSDCYIFDEPLNGLDDVSIELFIKEIEKLFKNGKLIIISTHQLEKFNTNNMKVIRLGELF